MTNRKKLEAEYNFYLKLNGEIIIQVKTGEDQPYRIKTNRAGKLVLEQFWHEFINSPGKWYVKKKDEDVEILYAYIIKRHNKSCEYMKNWNRI